MLNPMCTTTSSPYFKAVLFDRDGTLIEDRHYLSDPEGVALVTGARELVSFLLSQQRQLFVVSNQSGIGRGLFSREDADACNARMVELLASSGSPFNEIIYCPHAPGEGCNCRKPAIGMWHHIAANFAVDAPLALMVGDKVDDLLFASNAGLGASALVLTGKGEKTAQDLGIQLAGDEEFLLFPPETRQGFPQIVARNCAALCEALPLYEQQLREGNWHGIS